MSSFLVTIFTACALIAEPEAFTTFKSTLYGFSFDYPASWVKEPVALCGHEWKENPKEVRDRKLWPVIYLYPERRGEEGQLRPAIHVRYQAIRTEGEYAPLRESANSSTSDTSEVSAKGGLTGSKFESKADAGDQSPVSMVNYWFSKDDRLLVLSCMDGGRGLGAIEPICDEIARTVEMAEPFSELLNPKELKTFKKECASFSYPDDWSRAVRSTDDDDGFRFEAPHVGEETGTIQLLFDNRSLAQYEAESRASFLKNAHWFEIGPFENSKGQEGLKVAADIGFGKTNRVTWFVLPCSDGRLAVLFCWDHDNDDLDWDAAFTQVAQTFVVD